MNDEYYSERAHNRQAIAAQQQCMAADRDRQFIMNELLGSRAGGVIRRPLSEPQALAVYQKTELPELKTLMQKLQSECDNWIKDIK